MNRTIAGLLAGAALILAAPTTAATAGTETPSVHAACTNARIQGDRRCIAAGQFCRHSRSANRDYHRYGFHCGRRDRNGSYHLRYR
jgi:hypothetical protein